MAHLAMQYWIFTHDRPLGNCATKSAARRPHACGAFWWWAPTQQHDVLSGHGDKWHTVLEPAYHHGPLPQPHSLSVDDLPSPFPSLSHQPNPVRQAARVAHPAALAQALAATCPTVVGEESRAEVPTRVRRLVGSGRACWCSTPLRTLSLKTT